MERKTAFIQAVIAGIVFGAGILVSAVSKDELLFWTSISAAVVIILTYLALYYCGSVPLEKLKKLIPSYLDAVTDSLIERMKTDHGINVRMNIMSPNGRVRNDARPHFEIIWQRGMEYQPDVNISFPVDVGVAGKCFDQGVPIFAPAEQLKNFPFPDNLKQQTEQLSFVLSYPLYEPSNGGTQSDARIGVLNLDSKTVGADDIVKSDFERITQDMDRIARIVGQFFPHIG